MCPVPDASANPSFPSPTVARLERALAAAVVQDQQRSDGLADLVRSRVRELRAAGLPPERTLIAMKALVTEAMLQHVPGWTARDLVAERESLMAQVVRWCVAGYYDDCSGPEAPEIAVDNSRDGPIARRTATADG